MGTELTCACLITFAITTTWGRWQRHRNQERIRVILTAAADMTAARQCETTARAMTGMAAGHPEHFTTSLAAADEEWLADTALRLWPAGDPTGRHPR